MQAEPSLWATLTRYRHLKYEKMSAALMFRSRKISFCASSASWNRVQSSNWRTLVKAGNQEVMEMCSKKAKFEQPSCLESKETDIILVTFTHSTESPCIWNTFEKLKLELLTLNYSELWKPNLFYNFIMISTVLWQHMYNIIIVMATLLRTVGFKKGSCISTTSAKH